jgi:hypothetical protein
MKCPLAFIAMLTLAACASTPPKDQPAPTPPSAANDCHCDDNPPDNLHSFAFKGRVVTMLAEQGEVRVAFDEIPGALPAGTHDFRTAPEVLSAVQPGRDILARIELHHGEWWLFDVRLLVPLRTAQ